jgi:hypothetical protein
LLILIKCGVCIELINCIAVIHGAAGSARKRPVTYSEIKQEVAWS